MISKEELEILGAAASRYGIRHFKCAEFEVTFTELAPKLVMADGKTTRPIGDAHGMPTDDELLFASSPFPMTREEIEAAPP